MLWIESVFSRVYQPGKTMAKADGEERVDTRYGIPSTTWRTSATIVPKTPTITTASQ